MNRKTDAVFKRKSSSAIALRLHTTVEYLAYVNGISNPDKIRIGQVIKY